MMVIDYCMFCVSQKVVGIDNFVKIFNGCGGVEECMVVLWDVGVNFGCLIFSEFVVIMLVNVVRLFNMYLCKGVIVEGVDVDFVLWDLVGIKMFFVKIQFLKNDFNIFEGCMVCGILSQMIV